MTVSPNNSLPRVIALGIDDDSGTLLPIEQEAIPIHLPLIPNLAAWGPAGEDELVLTGGSGYSKIFGSDSLDELSPFYVHQNVLAKTVLAEGNLCYFYRVLPEDADIARLRLCIDIVADDVVQYERNVDESFKLDADGNKIPVTGSGATVAGYHGRWVVQAITTVNDVYQFALGQAAEGELVSGKDGSNSKIYPILDIETRFKGSKGNNLGFRLQAPTTRSVTPINSDLVNDAGAYVYRFYSVSRNDERTTGKVRSTRLGEQYVDFTLKSGVVDTDTRKKYGIDDVLLGSYEADDPDAFDGYGDFGRVHVYQNHLAEVLGLIYGTEENFGTVTAAVTPEQAINILTAVNVEGTPYYSFFLDAPADGGTLFTENTNHYCRSGSDGTVSVAKYEEGVGALLDMFNTETNKYEDMLKYPFSFFWDSGFNIDIKQKMPYLLNRRNLMLMVSTQDASRPLNSASEESSMAVALRAFLRSVPESDFFGTSTCRACVVGHAGKLIGDGYKGVLPFTIALAKRCAAYMGSGTGYMQPNAAIDESPNNVITEFKDHNVTFKPESARGVDWNNGLIHAQPFDTRRIFWPGLRTVYDDPTSILTTFLNVVIACRLTYIGYKSWARLSGNAKLTNLQYIDRADSYIEGEATASHFDGRVDITPTSSYTVDDVTRGFSYHTSINMAGQGMKTVNTLTIVANRRLDEETA